MDGSMGRKVLGVIVLPIHAFDTSVQDLEVESEMDLVLYITLRALWC